MRSTAARLGFVVVLAGAMLGAGRSAFAQAQDEWRFAVAGSYSYLREQGNGGAPAIIYNKGWVADVDWRLGARLTIAGELGGSYRRVQSVETQSVYGFLGGIRVALLHAGAAHVFAQGLVGLEHFGEPGFSEGGLALQPGAGVDVAVTRRFCIRVQSDFRLAREDGATFKEVRASAGVVWNLGQQRWPYDEAGR